MVMLKVLEIGNKYQQEYNQLVKHPLQTWEWGEFRKTTEVKVVRRGIFENENLVSGFQLTIHKIPSTHFTIGYLPKGELPTKEVLEELREIGKDNNCLFIKLEPNILAKNVKIDSSLTKSPHPLFTKYSFWLDLTRSEEELMLKMKSKTRYNVRLASRKGVTIVEDNSDTAFEEYLKLTMETTKRQHFFAHTKGYHRKMWSALYPIGMAHLLKAVYKGETVVSWVLFLHNDILYYPYGSSASKNKDTMASNLLMWEVIRWGKEHNAKLFDMWGALGLKPDPKDSWYGFHRFKEGYGATHVEFVETYDLVLKPVLYRLYNLVFILRQLYLKLKSSL